MVHIPQDLQVAIRDYLAKNPVTGKAKMFELFRTEEKEAHNNGSDFPGDTPFIPADSYLMDALLNAIADTGDGTSRKKVILLKFVWAVDREWYEHNWTSNNSEFLSLAEKKYRLTLNGLMEAKEKAGLVEPNEATPEYKSKFAERFAFDKARQEREKKMRW